MFLKTINKCPTLAFELRNILLVGDRTPTSLQCLPNDQIKSFRMKLKIIF